MRTPLLTMLLAGCLALISPATSLAALVLSFDQPSYSISNIGGTVQVPVYLSQNLAGPQVDIGNELLTSGIIVDFNNPNGIAQVLSLGDILPSLAFDFSSAGFTTSNASISSTSLIGISDLSSPILLGTFVFTGISPGTTTISVASISPGPSFVTLLDNVTDPVNTPTATISVVPEPSMYAALAAIFGCCYIGRRRSD